MLKLYEEFITNCKQLALSSVSVHTWILRVRMMIIHDDDNPNKVMIKTVLESAVLQK